MQYVVIQSQRPILVTEDEKEAEQLALAVGASVHIVRPLSPKIIEVVKKGYRYINLEIRTSPNAKKTKPYICANVHSPDHPAFNYEYFCSIDKRKDQIEI